MNYDILINKHHPLNKNYIPNNLVTINNIYLNDNPKINQDIVPYFIMMKKSAKEEGYDILIDSGYRSYKMQQDIWDLYVKEKGIEETQDIVALPGYSEHQTGLAIDVALIINGCYITQIDDSYDAIKWLFNNSYKYGFILRYPKNKEDITGYKFEPWHYRFVGLPLARKLYEENITLEEYYINEKN